MMIRLSLVLFLLPCAVHAQWSYRINPVTGVLVQARQGTYKPEEFGGNVVLYLPQRDPLPLVDKAGLPRLELDLDHAVHPISPVNLQVYRARQQAAQAEAALESGDMDQLKALLRKMRGRYVVPVTSLKSTDTTTPTTQEADG